MFIDPILHENIVNVLDRFGITSKTYFVGGAVRDHLYDTEPHDYDLVVERVSDNELAKLREELKETGKKFPVFRFVCQDSNETEHEIEMAAARIETSTGPGHNDFEVEYGYHITLYDDLHRRDLTINAMAINVLDLSELIDPFYGLYDLDNKVLRHTSYKFREDPLRVFRLARFATKFNDFSIDEDTIKFAKAIKSDTLSLPGDRVYDELVKTFKLDEPSKFFKVLRDLNNLDLWFPELNSMIGIIQPEKWHGKNDVFDHVMEAIDRAATISNNNINVMFGALAHDFGKVLTPKEILPHHYEHDNRGFDLLENFVKRLRIPNKIHKVMVDSIKYHMRIPKVSIIKKHHKLFRLVGPLTRNDTFDDVIMVSQADRGGRNPTEEGDINKLRLVRSIIKENLPQHIVDKLNNVNDGKSKQSIITEYRVRRYKESIG